MFNVLEEKTSCKLTAYVEQTMKQWLAEEC